MSATRGPSGPSTLQALYATTRALTELASVDDVLQSIVRHSHLLIGTDLVYVTVFDNGQSTMRAVEGTFSEEFRSARLEHGVGIAGLVEATHAPAWTDDYPSGTGFRRSTQFDHLMRLEGIISVLGVPLLDDGELRGVLFAGQRSRRSFTPDEIAMFSTFANHAAISLRNARIYQGSQDAVEELTRLQQVVEKTASSLRRVNTFHGVITDTVLHGGSYSEVLARLLDAVPGSAALYDDRLALLCSSDELASTAIREIVNANWSERSARSATTHVVLPDRWHATMVPVTAAEDQLGLLVHLSEEAANDEDDHIVERCGQMLAMLLLRQRAVVDAGLRARGEIVSEILRTTGPLSDDAIYRARARDIEVNQMDGCVAIAPPSSNVLIRLLAATNSLGATDMVFGERGGAVVGLMNLGKSTVGPDRLFCALQDAGFHGFALVAEPFSPAEAIGPQLSRVTRMSKVARALGKTDAPVNGAHIASYALLFESARASDLGDFIDGHLGPLDRYDSSHRTALRQTLTAYFAHDGHLRATAESLFIHQNTLVKRLARVDEILGDDWKRSPNSTMLAIACQLAAVAEELAIPSG